MTSPPLTRQDSSSLVQALRKPRYEVLPVDGIEDEIGSALRVPGDVTVTVTASTRYGVDATIALTERLSRWGFRVVPHLAARQVRDTSHLVDILARLDGAGVREAFVIAGDRATAIGPYHDAFTLLTAMSHVGHGLERIGIAGYPGRHPFISESALARALADKAPFATHLVSQLCFDPTTIGAWIDRVRASGVDLPIHLGIAGVVDRRRLLRIATKIGVGESARFLRKHRRPMLRLALPHTYRPDRMVREPAPAGVDGLHIYTFNNVRATEQWRQRMLSRWERVA